MGTNIRLGIGIPNSRRSNVEPPIPVIESIVTIILTNRGIAGYYFPYVYAWVKVSDSATGEIVFEGRTNSEGKIVRKFTEGSYIISSNDQASTFALSGDVQLVVADNNPQTKEPTFVTLKREVLSVSNWFGSSYDEGGTLTYYIIVNATIDSVNIGVPSPGSATLYLEITPTNPFWAAYQEKIRTDHLGKITYPGGLSSAILNAAFMNTLSFAFTTLSGDPIQNGKVVLTNPSYAGWSKEILLTNGVGEIVVPSDGMTYDWAFSYEGSKTSTGQAIMNKADQNISEVIDDSQVSVITLNNVEGLSFDFYGEYKSLLANATINWGDGQSETILNGIGNNHTYTTAGPRNITINDNSNLLELIEINIGSKSTIESVEFLKFEELRSIRIYNCTAASIDFSALIGLTQIRLYSNPNLTSVNITKNAELTTFYSQSNPIATLPNFTGNAKLSRLSLVNSKLTYYNYSSFSLPEISSLDFNSNLLLESVTLSGYSKLTLLNVSGCATMRELRITNSPLATLSGINTLTELSGFRINSTIATLTSIDVSMNLKLKIFRAQRLPLLTSIKMNKQQELTEMAVERNAMLVDFITDPPKSVDDCSLAHSSFTSIVWNGSTITAFDLSNNLNLITADISSNKTKSLSAANCSLLTTLKCQSNGLTILNLTGLVKLDLLECYSNKLALLDISSCILLRSLDLRFNSLSSLDVSKNVALAQLNVGANETLSSLDVSKNLILGEFLCDNCIALAPVDISKNIALWNFAANSCTWGTIDLLPNINLKQVSLQGATILSNQLNLIAMANSLPVRVRADSARLIINNSTASGWIQAICSAKFWSVF